MIQHRAEMNCGLKNEFSIGKDPFSPFVKKTVVEKGVLGAVRSTLGAKININCNTFTNNTS